MKRFWTILTIIFTASSLILLWQPTDTAYALDHIKTSIKLPSGTKYISYVEFHPAENLMIKPAFAAGGIGSTSSLQEMAEQHQAVAAINGTYFNAYDQADLHPMGAIMIDREYVHIRGGSTVMGITASGGLDFTYSNYARIEITQSGSVDRTSHASFINHMITSPREIVIFTPAYRSDRVEHEGAVFVTVSAGVVTSIDEDAADIPADGYVIAFSTDRVSEAERFQPGDSVEYQVTFSTTADMAQHLISVGPKLVTDGEIDVDFDRDGIRDPKMTTLSAGRSFIGSKEDGTIVFGTVSNVTIQELAEIMLRLGLHEAMNLDGGASSGLYYDGSLITRPGRQLSNSLVVVRQTRVPRIQVNGEELFFVGRPYAEQGHTMVPAEFLTSLGASLTWDEDNNTLTGSRFETSIRYTAGSDISLIDGVEHTMPVPAVMRDGLLYIPLRHSADAFGATIEWDGDQYLVKIQFDPEVSESAPEEDRDRSSDR